MVLRSLGKVVQGWGGGAKGFSIANAEARLWGVGVDKTGLGFLRRAGNPKPVIPYSEGNLRSHTRMLT